MAGEIACQWSMLEFRPRLNRCTLVLRCERLTVPSIIPEFCPEKSCFAKTKRGQNSSPLRCNDLRLTLSKSTNSNIRQSPQLT